MKQREAELILRTADASEAPVSCCFCGAAAGAIRGRVVRRTGAGTGAVAVRLEDIADNPGGIEVLTPELAVCLNCVLYMSRTYAPEVASRMLRDRLLAVNERKKYENRDGKTVH